MAHLGADHEVHTPSGSDHDQKDINSDQESGSGSSDSSPVYESSKKKKDNRNLTQAEVESAMYKVFTSFLVWKFIWCFVYLFYKTGLLRKTKMQLFSASGNYFKQKTTKM